MQSRPPMEMLHTFSMVRKLWTEGGLEICTWGSESRENKADDAQDAIFLKTLIQPDGNFLFYVTPEALEQPALCQIHLKKIGDVVRSVARSRFFFNVCMQGLRVAGVAMISLSCWEGWQGVWREQAVLTALGGLVGIPAVFAKKIAMLSFKAYVRRKISRQ